MQLRDLLLPFIVVTIVGMMIFPLPSGCLDLLLTCNIAASLILLLSAVYLTEPERFTSLPTVLLLSTLFRLGLNISTTRQLLGVGEAPDVVAAFGNFVVGGNLVVGAVIFLIITLVQFMVIAKGAERVAEVAARFTLDAMPGKQMAIDADIRAGILSLAEARDRRRDLQRESKLYGALDGALKFVKGDAIAGLIITFLNISGGLIVGMLQHGLSFRLALQKYTLFTIGDGLVSQIPALLTAVAAGISVTRVADKENSFVGREVYLQLGREPQALTVAAVVLFALAFAPGMPFAFAALGGIFLVAGYRGRRVQNKVHTDARETEFRPKVMGCLALRFNAAAVQLLQNERVLPGLAQQLRTDLFDAWGVLLSDFQFDTVSGAGSPAAEIFFRDVMLRTVRQDEARPDAVFSEDIAAALRGLISEYRAEFLDDTHTRALLELHQATCEDLINSVVPKIISVTTLTTVLRTLVREHVSIRSLATILQAIAESGGESRSLVREVRIALRRTISRSLASSDWKVEAWLLNSRLDHALAAADAAGTSPKPELIEYMESEIDKRLQVSPGSSIIILTTKFARAILSRAFEERIAEIRVVAVENEYRRIRVIQMFK